MKNIIKALIISTTISFTASYADNTPSKPTSEKIEHRKERHEEWKNLSPEERKAKREQFLKEHPEAKAKMEEIRKRHEEFEKLSPEEKKKRHEQFLKDHPEAKARMEEFKKNHPDWDKLTPEQKHERMRKFHHEHPEKFNPDFKKKESK
jgi:hypothetical protein